LIDGKKESFNIKVEKGVVDGVHPICRQLGFHSPTTRNFG
jgi:hypothetical protein